MSNFLQSDLDKILEHGTVVPHASQILAHAGNTPTNLLDYCQSKGILVEAYSPIAHGETLKKETVFSREDHGGVREAAHTATL